MAAALVVALLAIAGCGSSSSPLSTQEFEQQLKLVCNKGTQEREAILTQITKAYYERREQAPTPQYQAGNVRKLFASYERTTEAIRDLGLPKGGEEKAESLIKAREAAAAKVAANAVAARGHLFAIVKPANDRARAYGAQSCVF
ncbi:MAG TPA: hypothetical protein VFS64_06380 [Solirubrobacterales bacterium]|nr:hypothetical protein [Solirubrobacterales bacterium]